MPNMNGSNKKKRYYQIHTHRNVSFDELVNMICRPGSGLTEGDVVKVMSQVTDEMKRVLAMGNTVTIDGLGTFSLSIGVKPGKSAEDFEAKGKRLTSKQLTVRGVNFRPAKQMVKDIASTCVLHKKGTVKNNQSPFSPEERQELAHDYLAKHPFMRVKDYELLTKLSHASAAKELRTFCSQPTDIASEGKGNSKVYVLRQPIRADAEQAT